MKEKGRKRKVRKFRSEYVKKKRWRKEILRAGERDGGGNRY